MACLHGLCSHGEGSSGICSRYEIGNICHGTRSIEKFALLVARIRDDTRLINAFARFSLQVQSIRKVWFRRLSSEAMKVELAERIAALDV